MGAFRVTEISMVPPGLTFPVKGTAAAAPIWSPPVKTKLYAVVQVQEPSFPKRQVFTKLSPAFTFVLSGKFTSVINLARSHGTEVVVGTGEAVAGRGKVGGGDALGKNPCGVKVAATKGVLGGWLAKVNWAFTVSAAAV